MDIGFIGLGRMGANMVRRLTRDGHQIVIYNRTPEKTRELAGEEKGATAVFSIADLVAGLAKPRAVWVMVPAGDATEAAIAELASSMLDARRHDHRRRQHATSQDDVRRARRARREGHPLRRRRAPRAASGACRVGYCLMVGGEPSARSTASSRSSRRSRPPDGYAHAAGTAPATSSRWSTTAIEYGMMQAYAEGFEILEASDYDLDLAADRRPLEAGQRRALVAARAGGPRVQAKDPDLEQHQGVRRGLRRGPLDGRRRRSTTTCPRR